MMPSSVLSASTERYTDSGTRTPQVDTVSHHVHQLLDEHLGGPHLHRVAAQRHPVAAHEHVDERVLLLDGAQQAVLRAEEPDHGHAVDFQVDSVDRRVVRIRSIARSQGNLP